MEKEFKNGDRVNVPAMVYTIPLIYIGMTPNSKYVVEDALGFLYKVDECIHIKPPKKKKKIPLTFKEIADLALDGAWFKSCDDGDGDVLYIQPTSLNIRYETWWNGEDMGGHTEFINTYKYYRLPGGKWLPLTKEV